MKNGGVEMKKKKKKRMRQLQVLWQHSEPSSNDIDQRSEGAMVTFLSRGRDLNFIKIFQFISRD